MTLQHRVAVRDQVAAILAAAVPAVDGRVFRARTWPLSAAETPALLVYGWQEERTRTGGDASQSRYAVRFTLAVEARVSDRSRDTEEVEAELEALTGAVEEAILTSAELLLPPRLVETIAGTKTTFGIDTRTSELAIGRALVAVELTWTEIFEVPEPAVDCGADATSLRLRPIPPP